MRKLLQASVILLLFAVAILIVQSSCSKSEAQISNAAITQINKFVYLRAAGQGPEIWVSDYNGSNASKIPVVMPAGSALSSDFGQWEVRLSPDGQTLFFLGVLTDTNTTQIYSCHIDGSNVQVVVPGTVRDPNSGINILRIGGAY